MEKLAAGPADVIIPWDGPELATVNVHLPAVHPVQPMIESCGPEMEVPNRPKTNVAMATAATRVMAIKMTVAKTGDTPFLRTISIGKGFIS